jgi:serine/threonine protein kinase
LSQFILFLQNKFVIRKAIKKYKQQIPLHFNIREIEKKFKIEINQLKSYNNEYIIKYLDDFIQDNYLYLVFEYCEVLLFLEIYNIILSLLFKNGDLSRHLIKHTNIEKEVLIKWFKQIVLGLKELNRHKCHHRDLKTGFDCNDNLMTKKLITLF